MPDTSLDRELAQSAIEALETREYGHPSVHSIACLKLLAEALPPIAEQFNGLIPAEPFDSALRTIANEASLRDKGADELKTLLRAYRLVRQENDSYRILNSTDNAAPWLGFDLLSAKNLNNHQRIQHLAHLHMLAYPELLEVIELLSPPGRSKADVERTLKDKFGFTRKINANIAAYLVTVANEFSMASIHGEHLIRNTWSPPSVLGALVVKNYLALTGYVVDRGVDTDDLLRQCAAVVPGSFFQRHPVDTEWYRSLGAPSDACVSAVGGTQLRIRLEGIIWFARAGLVAPISCAYVLKERRAKESLGRLRVRLMDRVKSFTPVPVNTDEINADLADA